MLHQFNAQRFRWWNGRRIGTIAVGTIVYIQDGIRPLNGIGRPITRRIPWLVEAWLNRDYAKWSSGKLCTVKIAGGHLAQVRSLRDGRRLVVAAWILLACVDAGLDRP
jgi:hypothetical protein